MQHPSDNVETIIKQVPVTYYQTGVQTNVLQRLWHTNKLRVVCSVIQGQPKSILDVGCASGWFLSQLANRYPRARCTGVDIYKEAIAYGTRLYPKLRLIHADASKIPLPDGSCDLIVCNEVLEHVSNPQAVLTEIKRLLAPGGCAIIEMDTGNMLFRFVWSLWTSAKGKVWHDAHVFRFNEKILEDMIKNVGFTTKEKRIFNTSMAVAFRVKSMQPGSSG